MGLVMSSVGIRPAGQAAAWFTAMANQTWATPVSNTLDSVKSGTDITGVTNAWTPGMVDESTGELLLSHNGGHGDPGGNETYGCKLKVANPAWVRLTDPSTGSGGDQALGSLMVWGDGLRVPDHGYHKRAFAKGRMWFAGVGGASVSASYSKVCYSIDRATLTQTYHGNPAIGGAGGGGYETGPSIYDPVGQRIYALPAYADSSGGHTAYSIDVNSTGTGDITEYDWNFSGNPLHLSWGFVAWDKSPRCLIIGSINETRLWILNLEDIASGWTQKTTTGAYWNYGSGAVYHPASSGALVYHTDLGAELRKLSVPSNPLTGSYSWSTISPSGSNAITPPGSFNGTFNGVYSKFNIVQDMGNGQSALVFVASVTGSTYVYKLPSAGV